MYKKHKVAITLSLCFLQNEWCVCIITSTTCTWHDVNCIMTVNWNGLVCIVIGIVCENLWEWKVKYEINYNKQKTILHVKDNTHRISFRLHECEFPGPEKWQRVNKFVSRASYVVGGVKLKCQRSRLTVPHLHCWHTGSACYHPSGKQPADSLWGDSQVDIHLLTKTLSVKTLLKYFITCTCTFYTTK